METQTEDVRVASTTGEPGRVNLYYTADRGLELYRYNLTPDLAVDRMVEDFHYDRGTAIDAVNKQVDMTYRILCGYRQAEIHTDSRGMCTRCGKSFAAHQKARQ